MSATTEANCSLAGSESLLQGRAGGPFSAAGARAGVIERVCVGGSGAFIANLFQRGRPCGQKVRQRQQRPHADPKALFNGIINLRKRFRRQIRNRSWNRSSPAIGQPHHDELWAWSASTPHYRKILAKKPMAPRHNPYFGHQSIDNGGILR